MKHLSHVCMRPSYPSLMMVIMARVCSMLFLYIGLTKPAKPIRSYFMGCKSIYYDVIWQEREPEKNEKHFIDAPLNARTWEYVINSRMILHIQLSYISFARSRMKHLFISRVIHLFVCSFFRCFRPQVAAKIGCIKIVSGFASKCITVKYKRKYTLNVI